MFQVVFNSHESIKLNPRTCAKMKVALKKNMFMLLWQPNRIQAPRFSYFNKKNRFYQGKGCCCRYNNKVHYNLSHDVVTNETKWITRLC